MPAEWEPHEGTWLQWPHDDTYEGHQLELEHIWLMMAEALHQHEVVHIAVQDERRAEHLQHQVVYYGFDENNIDIEIIPTDDVWVRDNGPIFVKNEQGELAITDWNFNGWGERYSYEIDRVVPAKVAARIALPLYKAPITIEGGAIEVNGKGTLIATRSSIINPNRNPGVSQKTIEAAIKDYLGIDRIVWLSGAPREFCDFIGSDTDMHVDGYARFTDEATVLYSWTDDQSNVYYPYLKQHLEELNAATTESGAKLTLVALPKPENAAYKDKSFATRPPFKGVPSLGVYANFYVANKVVLVPIYGDVNDANARSIIAEHFPGRDIVGIHATPLAEHGGMMHCVTQQQPLAKGLD